MLNFPALDVALGLVFVFFILAVVCSGINEAIASFMRWRAQDLERGLWELLQDPERGAAALEKLKLDGDEQIGVNIVKRALEEPLRLIASNAGHEGAIVIGKVRESNKANYGFNAETEEYTDMIAAGILDPAKVTRSALQNATAGH